MSNRNRRRAQRENRDEGDDHGRRSHNAERNHENSEVGEATSSSGSRSEPRELRTWDDLVAEIQRRSAPQVQQVQIPVHNYQNHEEEDNRLWADIVEEELYQGAHVPGVGAEQAGNRLGADIVDEEMNPQEAIEAPVVQDDLQHDVQEPIDPVMEMDIVEEELLDPVMPEYIVDDEEPFDPEMEEYIVGEEEEPIELALGDPIEEEEQQPIDLGMEEDSLEDEASFLLPADEEDNLGSPIQAPAHLIESDVVEEEDDYDIPIVWADVVDVELLEEDITISSNPGHHHHTKETSEHPLLADITKEEMSLLPPPLLPVVAHDSQPGSKEVTEEVQEKKRAPSVSPEKDNQNQEETVQAKDSEVDKPIHILWADEVDEERRTQSSNLQVMPAVQETVSKSKQERPSHWLNLPSIPTETLFANKEDFPHLAFSKQPAKKPKKKEGSEGKLPAKIIYVQDLERTWQTVVSHKKEKAKKEDSLLKSSLKSFTAKKPEAHATKDVKQGNEETKLPSIVLKPVDRLQSIQPGTSREKKEKPKPQWSNLLMDSENKTFVDDEHFPVLGSPKPQTRKRFTPDKPRAVENKQQKEPVPPAQDSIVSVILPNKDAAESFIAPKKKRSRVRWATLKTLRDEQSLDEEFPVLNSPVLPQRGRSAWRRPYMSRRQYYSNSRDRQQNRDERNFNQERRGRPWAETQYPTQTYLRSKSPMPYRGRRMRWVRNEKGSDTQHPNQRDERRRDRHGDQQRNERRSDSQHQNKRNEVKRGKQADQQKSERGSDYQNQRQEEKRGKRDDHRTTHRSPVKPTEFKIRKDDTQLEWKNPVTNTPESPSVEDNESPVLGTASPKKKSKFDDYVSPLPRRKTQRTTGDKFQSREPQKSRSQLQILKRSPSNASRQYAERKDYLCKTMQTEDTQPVPKLRSQKKVTTVDCAMQTIETPMHYTFLAEQSTETEPTEPYPTYENIGTNTEEVASDLDQLQEVVFTEGSEMSTSSLDYAPNRVIEVVNLKLKFKDGTVVEDEFIPEPVPPLRREDGSVDPTAQLQYLLEKREYFQARCRKLITKHYPKVDIRSKRPNETYEDMYNRLMQEETQRLYNTMKAQSMGSLPSTNVGKTTDTAEQRTQSRRSKQPSPRKELKAEGDVTNIPEEKDEQTMVSDSADIVYEEQSGIQVESEHAVYPEETWKNDEEANKILDEQEMQQIGWLMPKSRKWSKSKKTKSTDKKNEVAGSTTRLTPRKSSVPRKLEAQYEKASTAEPVRSVLVPELPDIDLNIRSRDAKSKESKVKTDTVEEQKTKNTDKKNKGASSKKKPSVYRNLEAQYEKVCATESLHSVPVQEVPDIDVKISAQDAKSKEQKIRTNPVEEKQISESIDLTPVPNFDDLEMELDELQSEEIFDDVVPPEQSPSPCSKSKKKSKSKGKKKQEATVSVVENVEVSEEEILIEPVPPTPEADGYIDPEAKEKYQQERQEYFEAKCRQLIKKHYPTVDINSRRKKESYEGMYKRLLNEEAKLLAERNKKSQKYFQKQKEAADRKMNRLMKDKTTPTLSPCNEPKAKDQKKKPPVKPVPVLKPTAAAPKESKLRADIMEKTDSSDPDPTEKLRRPEEFVFADDEEDSSSSINSKHKVQKRYKTRKNILENRADESEPEAPIPFHLSTLAMLEKKASGDEDNVPEPDPPFVFFAPKEFLPQTEEQAQSTSESNKDFETKVTQPDSPKKSKEKKINDAQSPDQEQCDLSFDSSLLSDGDLHRPQTKDNKHVEFAEKMEKDIHVDVEEELPENKIEEIADPSGVNENHLQDEAAALLPSKTEEIPETGAKRKRRFRKKKAVSAEEEMIVSDSGAKAKQAKSCPALPVTEDKVEAGLTKSQRKRAKAKQKTLLAKAGEGNTNKEVTGDTTKVTEAVDDTIYEEPTPPVPGENGLIDPDVQAKYDKDKKEFFQAKCKRLIRRDYPNIDINSKLANETYEEMYNRLLKQERLNADRFFELELRKLDDLKKRFNRFKSKRK